MESGTRTKTAMLVVDASVAVKFVVEESGSDRAQGLLAGPDVLIAPDWLLAEAGHAMWKKVNRGELTRADAQRSLELLPDFFGSLRSARELTAAAYDLSFRLSHPVYDCLYLALAMVEDCRLVTVDGKFRAALARAGLSGMEYAL